VDERPASQRPSGSAGDAADLTDLEREIARLDRGYRVVADQPVDRAELDDLPAFGRRIRAELAELNTDGAAGAAVQALVDRYGTGDDGQRARIRALLDRYTGFRWGAPLAPDWRTATELRDQLLYLSARDQDLGLDVDALLTEVAALSSDVDRYGMGSTRELLLRCRQG
jgi:hypothetical protein